MLQTYLEKPPTESERLANQLVSEDRQGTTSQWQNLTVKDPVAKELNELGTSAGRPGAKKKEVAVKSSG